MAQNPFTFEKTAFEHWPNCLRFSNGIVDLVIPETFGPRVMSFGFRGGLNVFKIFPAPPSGAAPQRVRGGHRLWVAPEIPEITWVNDTAPVRVEFDGHTVTCTGTVEPARSLEKQMVISLKVDQAAVRILHRVTNRGTAPMHIAPWALTQLVPGGVAVAGLPPRGEHPRDLLPNGSLVMWPYTDLSDPKWQFLRKYVGLRQDAVLPAPQKFGVFSPAPWCAYLLDDLLFVKQAHTPRGAEYPDMGCSLEIFTNPFMMELETLGHLRTLHPGESAEHTERWTLRANSAIGQWSDDALDSVLSSVLSDTFMPLLIPR